MPKEPDGRPSFPAVGLVGAAAAALFAALAVLVTRAGRDAERTSPPTGTFVDVEGVKVHYIERGSGPPVVLLHGNGVNARDWLLSGVLDQLAATHRVIAIDRPGFGYSERPRGIRWTPEKQAEHTHLLLARLGVQRPTVVGHSYGTLVATALALDFPEDVARLVLVSGYFFPSLRIDSLMQAPYATPVLGDLLRRTIAPVIGRATAPLLERQLFAPAPVDSRFEELPLSLSLRPSQMRAASEEAATMTMSAARMQQRYNELQMPVAIISGSGDRVVSPASQSERLASLLNCDVQLVSGAGHMVHYLAPERIASVIDQRSRPLTETEMAGGGGP